MGNTRFLDMLKFIECLKALSNWAPVPMSRSMNVFLTGRFLVASVSIAMILPSLWSRHMKKLWEYVTCRHLLFSKKRLQADRKGSVLKQKRSLSLVLPKSQIHAPPESAVLTEEMVGMRLKRIGSLGVFSYFLNAFFLIPSCTLRPASVIFKFCQHTEVPTSGGACSLVPWEYRRYQIWYRYCCDSVLPHAPCPMPCSFDTFMLEVWSNWAPEPGPDRTESPPKAKLKLKDVVSKSSNTQVKRVTPKIHNGKSLKLRSVCLETINSYKFIWISLQLWCSKSNETTWHDVAAQVLSCLVSWSHCLTWRNVDDPPWINKIAKYLWTTQKD